ncbi:MAG: hypothetical protein JKY17_04820 [Magnetovibrio sp.]|nr:hypothetical protein [Magnetovibrio sp.]
MNALKGVVILMSLLIATIMAMMAYGLYQKSQNPDFKFFNLGTTDKAPAKIIPQAPVSGGLQGLSNAPVAFDDITLNLPKGARIISATPAGTQIIIITARDGVRADQVWVLDTTLGKILGSVRAGQ